MHVLIASKCTKTKLKSIKPIHHQILLFIGSKKIFASCLYSIRYVSYGHNIIEIKFTDIILLLEWPYSLSTQGKHDTLIYVPVHGKQTEPNPVLIACFSRSYNRLNKRL